MVRSLFDKFGLVIQEHVIYVFRSIDNPDEVVITTAEVGAVLHERGTHEFDKNHPLSKTSAVRISYGGNIVFVPMLAVAGTVAQLPAVEDD